MKRVSLVVMTLFLLLLVSGCIHGNGTESKSFEVYSSTTDEKEYSKASGWHIFFGGSFKYEKGQTSYLYLSLLNEDESIFRSRISEHTLRQKASFYFVDSVDDVEVEIAVKRKPVNEDTTLEEYLRDGARYSGIEYIDFYILEEMYKDTEININN